MRPEVQHFTGVASAARQQTLFKASGIFYPAPAFPRKDIYCKFFNCLNSEIDVADVSFLPLSDGNRHIFLVLSIVKRSASQSTTGYLT
jgi:hypothetical protein